MTPVRQPTPSVTEADVERIVRRDYPANVAGEILELIATVSVREKPRVVLACLKIANGDLDRLRANLSDASGYYRVAEGPMRLMVRRNIGRAYQKLKQLLER